MIKNEMMTSLGISCNEPSQTIDNEDSNMNDTQYA